VEDEGAVRNIMARTLRECGYTVLEAAHGLQALEILERHGVSVTLIIADVVMPQISGRELAERVLERWPDVPILFTSGYTGLYVVQRGLLDEGQEFIQKPIAPDTLAQKVREMLDSCPRQSGAARQFPASLIMSAGVSSMAKTIRNQVANDANSTLPGSSLERSSPSERVSG
jgi:CheY-like chemotaxis protein